MVTKTNPEHIDKPFVEIFYDNNSNSNIEPRVINLEENSGQIQIVESISAEKIKENNIQLPNTAIY